MSLYETLMDASTSLINSGVLDSFLLDELDQIAEMMFRLDISAETVRSRLDEVGSDSVKALS